LTVAFYAFYAFKLFYAFSHSSPNAFFACWLCFEHVERNNCVYCVVRMLKTQQARLSCVKCNKRVCDAHHTQGVRWHCIKRVCCKTCICCISDPSPMDCARLISDCQQEHQPNIAQLKHCCALFCSPLTCTTNTPTTHAPPTPPSLPAAGHHAVHPAPA
jgi:hypothetical protein